MAEPLVLVPGMMCDARVFEAQISALSAGRIVVISPPIKGETVEVMAEHILQNAPERFALAGLSLGGIVALEILRRAPDRVCRLALISTSALSETPSQAAEREPQIVGAKAGRLGEVMQEVMKPEYLAHGPQRVTVLNLMQDMALEIGADIFVRQSRALQRRPDQQKTLRTIHTPTYVICGSYDCLTPLQRQEFMATLIPYAEFRVIEEAGHLPTVEAPEATTEIMREWLSAPVVLR